MRISFAGGGTDIPEFYERHGGAVLSMTIKRWARVRLPQAGLVWDVDCPPGSGLGGSSALCVAAVKALAKQRGEEPGTGELIRRAFHLERVVMAVPGGMQDFAAAAAGGLNLIRFDPKRIDDSGGDITFERLPDATAEELARRCLLVPTGAARTDQGLAARKTEDCRRPEMVDKFVRLRADAVNLRKAAELGLWDAFAIDLRCAWKDKKASSPGCSTARADELIAAALAAGAGAGKLTGAGGGGFVLVFAEPERQGAVRDALAAHGAAAEAVEFESNGVHFTGE